jgi:predicted NAD/FAD-dependent oxidoreductase
MTASSPEAEVVVFAGAKVEGAFLSGTAAAAQMQVLL